MPLRAPVAWIRQALVPALGPDRHQPWVPVADVSPVVRRHQVLVPGDVAHRAVDVGDVARRVHGRQADDRADLMHPGRIAPGVGVAARALLDRAVHRPAEHVALLPRLRWPEVQEAGWRASVLEGLLAATHRPDLPVEVVEVGVAGNQPLGVERVRSRQPACEPPRDVLVVADRHERRARRGDAAHIQSRPVQLHLVELLGRRVAELRAVEEHRAVGPAVAERGHVRPSEADRAHQRRRDRRRRRGQPGLAAEVSRRRHRKRVDEPSRAEQRAVLLAAGPPGHRREEPGRARHGADLSGDPQGQDRVERLPPARPQRLRGVELDPVAVRRRPRQVDPDRCEVLDRERLRRIGERHELARHVRGAGLHVRDPRVDPRGVVAVALHERGGQAAKQRVDLGRRVEVPPDLEVHRDVVLAEDVGQVAGGRPPEELELEQPVLGGRVSGAPPELGGCVAGDGRHAECVPHDLDAGRRVLLGAGLAELGVLVAEVDVVLLLVV